MRCRAGEGVETEDQVLFLETLGCDPYQGYYFSAALEPAELTELILSAGNVVAST